MASRSMIGPPSAQSARNTAIRFRSRLIAMYSVPPSAKVAIPVTEPGPGFGNGNSHNRSRLPLTLKVALEANEMQRIVVGRLRVLERRRELTEGGPKGRPARQERRPIGGRSRAM